MLHGPLHHAVLLNSAVPRELRGPNDRPEVITTALIDDLNLRAGQGVGDEALDLGEVGHRHSAVTGCAERDASTISSIRQNFTRGRPSGSPLDFSAASIASQP